MKTYQIPNYVCLLCEHMFPVTYTPGCEPSGLTGPPEDYDPGCGPEIEPSECPNCETEVDEDELQTYLPDKHDDRE